MIRLRADNRSAIGVASSQRGSIKNETARGLFGGMKLDTKRMIGEWWVSAACLLGISLGMLNAVSDPHTRLAFTADDAYYVTIPAKNLVEKGVPSIDGEHPTNGFHAAIFVIDCALAMIGVSDICLANIVLGYLFWVAAVLAMHRYLSRYAETTRAFFLTGAFAASPYVVAASITGLESSLFMFVMVLYYKRLLFLVEATRKGQGPRYRD
jgi:hypothetical protein